MERKALTAILVAALVLLAGCGGAVQQNQTTAAEPTASAAAGTAAHSTTDGGSGVDATQDSDASGETSADSESAVEPAAESSGGGDGDSDDGDSSSTADSDGEGTLSFYISDERNAIGDFDHLNVTIDKIGVQRAGAPDEESAENETDDPEDDGVESDDETAENETSEVVLAINAGGDAYETAANTTYVADNESYYDGGDTHTVDREIHGTEADTLYQSYRYGENFSYALDVENGSYDVTLQFAEVYYNESGQRVFDVSAENETVVSGLDVQNESGNDTAYDVTATVTVEDGQLDVAFDGTTENAMVSALVVERVESDSEEREETDEETDEQDQDQEQEQEQDQDEDGEAGGWTEYEVDSRTFDLTELQGDRASKLSDLTIAAGEYNKVFVYVADVEGVVDGETVNVKLPSQKLHLNKGFTVGENESVEFVYDITVHEAGNSGKYILKPVISQSGTSDEIAIEDVDETEESDDEESAEEHAFSVEFVGDVTPGENATVEVTEDDDPLANATVEANGESVGETDENGSLTVAVPADATELELSVTAGNETVELTREFESETPEPNDAAPGKSGENPGKGNDKAKKN
jgi:hypothetical protein